MIKFEHVTREFGNQKGVKDLNFEIHSGEITALLGRNGAGKTTTLKLMTGCLTPAAGKMTRQGSLGFVPDHAPVYPEMTLDAYLKFVAELRDIPNSEQGQAIDQIVSKFELEAVLDRIIGHLSKGYQQRIGLAQGLLHNPEILILDEPTASLDPEQQRQTREWLKTLAPRKAIVISSHSLDEVAQLASRILILKDGRLEHDIELRNRPLSNEEIGALI